MPQPTVTPRSAYESAAYHVHPVVAASAVDHNAAGLAQNAARLTIYGSFSQGFQSSITRFRQLEQIVLATPALASWKQAQDRLDAFMRTSTKLMSGTRISNTGFF
jgi:hypothetical protein